MTDRIHIEGLTPAHVALLKQVADEAADKAVEKMFVRIGIDPDDPIKAQADMQWLRATRERCENVEGKAIMTLVGLLVVAIAGAVWAGLKFALRT